MLLSQRTYACAACGFTLERDRNACRRQPTGCDVQRAVEVGVALLARGKRRQLCVLLGATDLAEAVMNYSPLSRRKRYIEAQERPE